MFVWSLNSKESFPFVIGQSMNLRLIYSKVDMYNRCYWDFPLKQLIETFCSFAGKHKMQSVSKYGRVGPNKHLRNHRRRPFNEN